MKSFLTLGGWPEEKCVSVLKCFSRLKVRTHTRTKFHLNLSLLQMFVSRNVVSFSEISAINLLWGGICLLSQ